MEGPDLQFTEAVIDNGDLGRHVVGSNPAYWLSRPPDRRPVYLDDDTMVLSATTAQGRRARPSISSRLLWTSRNGCTPSAVPARSSAVRAAVEGAILACRLIDRPLRPCFVKGLRNEIQVIVTVMALNPNKLYDVAAINAASLSTQLAGCPSAVRLAAYASH